MSTSTKVVSGKIRMSDEETISKINSAIEAAKNAGASLWGGKVPQNLKTPLRDDEEYILG